MTLASDRPDSFPRSAVRTASRVLVVDDHRTFAELLAGALEAAGMVVLGMAHSAAQAIRMTQDMRPDVVIMDIEMPQQDGLTATRRIREASPATLVAVVTAHSGPDWVARAAQAGAAAFIPKNGSLAELLDILARVQPGHLLVAPSTFASGATVPRPRTAPLPQLTRREQEVLDGLGRGMQLTAIARRLGISVATCRGYVKTLHTKLGARSQLEAVVKAQQLGILGKPGGRAITELPGEREV